MTKLRHCLTLAVLAACHEPVTTQAPPAAVILPPTALPPFPRVAEGDAAPDGASVAAAEDAGGPLAPTFSDPREMVAWLFERGVDKTWAKQHADWYYKCSVVRLPAPVGEALVCEESAPRQALAGAGSVTRMSVIVVAGGRARTAWTGDVAVSTGLLREGPPALAETHHVQLIIGFDGLHMRVSEHPEANCHHLSTIDEDLRRANATYAKWVRSAVATVCQNVGRYLWKSGRFERE